MAILARFNPLQQLFYYYKSLGVRQPFISSRESILTALYPINAEAIANRGQHLEFSFARLHGSLIRLTILGVLMPLMGSWMG